MINKIANGIKELRLFSIGAFVFAAYLLNEMIMWITTKSNPTELGDGIAITTVVAALVGLCKFIFEFAIKKSNPGED